MLQRKKSREFQPKFLKRWVNCLLGEEKHPLWLIEFYGERECEIAKIALQQASNYRTIAYLDPFDNLRSQNSRPDLVLKPDALEQAIAMSLELFKTKIVELLMIDSLFLLPSQKTGYEESLVQLVKLAERYAKPVFLLNPDNTARRLLEKNLKSFCSSQIWVR